MEKGEIPARSVVRALAPEVLMDLCERAPDGVCVMDQPESSGDYFFTYINRAFEKIYLCDRSSVLGSSVQEFMRPRSTTQDQIRIREALARDEPFRVRRELTLDTEPARAIEIHFQLIPWPGGRRWMFITRDVTRERERHVRMIQLTTAVERGFDGVVISHRAGDAWTVQYVNDAFVRMTGFQRDEMIGRNFGHLIEDVRKIEDLRAALRSGQQVRTEIPMRRKDGTEGMFELSIQPVTESEAGPESVVSLIRDVSEIRRREAQLSYEARHDALTGLDNRRSFERALETAIGITRGTPSHALLFADLDGFKAVNDRLGHEAGDRVLKAAADAFRHALFDSDVLARWGGDEFAAVLFHCSLENAVENAERVARRFRENPDREGADIGIGVVPILPGETVSKAMERADRACYLAKSAGRGRIHWERAPKGE